MKFVLFCIILKIFWFFFYVLMWLCLFWSSFGCFTIFWQNLRLFSFFFKNFLLFYDLLVKSDAIDISLFFNKICFIFAISWWNLPFFCYFFDKNCCYFVIFLKKKFVVWNLWTFCNIVTNFVFFHNSWALYWILYWILGLKIDFF